MSIFDKLFPQQATQEQLDQFMGVGQSSTTIDPNQLVGQGQQTLTGGLQLPATQHVYHPPGAAGGLGQLTPQQIQQILQTFQVNILTAEEQKELQELRREYEISIKGAKLNEFKKLPAELRQFVINVISWSEAKEQIESARPDKPDRLKELEQKESNSGMFGSLGGLSGMQSFHQWHSTSVNADFQLDFGKFFPIPAGVTAEELKEAHIEATLEEEMLDSE